MASGFPDYQTQEGRNVGGRSIDSYSFSVSIPGNTIVIINIPEVPTGEEKFYQGIAVGIDDDKHIAKIQLTRESDTFVWWSTNFVMGGSWELPGFKFSAGQQTQVRVTNNSDSSVTLTGAIFITTRTLE